MSLGLTSAGACGMKDRDGRVPLVLRECRCPNCGRLIAQEQMESGTLKLRCPKCRAFVILSRPDNQAGGTLSASSAPSRPPDK